MDVYERPEMAREVVPRKYLRLLTGKVAAGRRIFFGHFEKRMKIMTKTYSPDTSCVHGPVEFAYTDPTGAVSFPLYQTATFAHPGVGQSTGFDYSRGNNPTVKHVEEIVTSLEKGSAGSVGFASGMAAICAALGLFSPGDHIIATQDLYGGTTRLFDQLSARCGLDVSLVDTSDIKNVRKAIRPETRGLYIETPANPMMEVSDLEVLGELAREEDLIYMVDNTFLSPYLQNPHRFGADLVIHSASKFLSGHNDTIAGFVSCKDEELLSKIQLFCMSEGGILAPFDAWLLIRGIKTLAIRVEKQQENARKIVDFLQEHDKIETVYYPGLGSPQEKEILNRQTSGTGSMISFRVKSADAAKKLLEEIRLITFAESLGGCESLLTYPYLQTHADVPEALREELGITDTLLRLSVGIEDAEDLIEDLDQALRKANA